MYPYMSSTGGFHECYCGYSVSMLPGQEREDVERGGKIIMPPGALKALTRLNITYPMLFLLRNPRSKRMTHCGVLEFIAEEEKVYLPHWMMNNLSLDEGGRLEVESVSLPVATFSRFQPQSPDFLDIYNPKAVLENTLRAFACLTAGDVINIKYNQKNYELSVLETQPGDAVSIIECDMNVEFAPPLGYIEPEDVPPEDKEEEEEEAPGFFLPFVGQGHRLDGKQKKSDEESPKRKRQSLMRGVPDFDWKLGTLVFKRNNVKSTPIEKKEDGFQPFSGSGNALT